MLVVKDYFTKWTDVYRSPDHRDFKVVHKLTAFYFYSSRLPPQLHSDKG